MKNRIIFLFLVGALAQPARDSYAQGDSDMDLLPPSKGNRFFAGIVGSVNIVMYKSTSFPIFNSEPTCFPFKNGSGFSPVFGLNTLIPMDASMRSFIVLEALYDSKSARFNEDGNARSEVPTKINGAVIDGTVVTDLTATLSYLVVNAGYKFNFKASPIPSGFGIQLCTSLGLKLAGNFNKTVTISAPGPSITSRSSTPIDGIYSVRIGLRGQLTYDILLSWTLFLTPTVGYDLPISAVDSTSRSWKAASAYGGIMLHYCFGN